MKETEWKKPDSVRYTRGGGQSTGEGWQGPTLPLAGTTGDEEESGLKTGGVTLGTEQMKMSSM